MIGCSPNLTYRGSVTFSDKNLHFIYSINRAIYRPSDHTVGRPPGLRFELGTGGPEAVTLYSDGLTSTPPNRFIELAGVIGWRRQFSYGLYSNI